jgi:PTS system glucitol/sorbitol-specific IIA component
MSESGQGTVYSSTVTKVGDQVPAFLEHGILIFFADHAPEELHDLSVLHRVEVTDDGPRPGDTIHLGETSLEILAVGEVVRDNLLNLGHLDLKADGRTEVKLPGDVCVATGSLPLMSPGDTFAITRPT